MRVDKWLWAMRIYKTRSIATDACKNNRISVNGQLVKAAKEVKTGDEVRVKKMPVVYSYKIVDLPKSRQGAANVPLFMHNTTPQNELDKLDQKIAVFVKRDKGTGRPTKRERREIDFLMDTKDFDSDMEWDDDLDEVDNSDDEDLGEGYKNHKQKTQKEIEEIDFNF